MGQIICARKQENGKIIVELQLQPEEFRSLRGEMDCIHIFSERCAVTPSKVSLRGRNEATQYFLIPKQLRKQLPIHGSVSCQRIEHEGRMVFVYVVDPYKKGNHIMNP